MVLSCIIMTGCGFHLRSGKALPHSLRHIYYAADNPYAPTSVQLTQVLTGMNVHFSKKKSQVKYTLSVTNDHFITARAQNLNANLPSSVTYSQGVTIGIINNQTQRIIASKQFSASESQTLNANQIYAPHTNDTVRQSLSQQIETRIYYWLTSTTLKDTLKHADQLKSAKHSS